MPWGRTLRKDYARYSKDEEADDMERDLGDEYGWKQIHDDVFRPASNAMMFSVLIGAGYHMTLVVFCVISFAILGELYTDETPSSPRQSSSTRPPPPSTSTLEDRCTPGWTASSGLLSALVCGTAFFINFIVIYYHASRAIPFGTMVAVTCICFFVILPVTLIGTIVGRNLDGQPDFPCRVNAVPRPIPEKKWFMEPAVIILLDGVLPFGSIFIEMYFIFTS